MKKYLMCFLFLCIFAQTGCISVANDYMDDTALTLPEAAPVNATMKSIDIPVAFFDDDLPARFQHKGIGIINDQMQFQALWRAYTNENTALPPIIDFEKYVLLFVYDAQYYNLVKICGIHVHQGIANPIVERTNWTLTIGGSEAVRHYRNAMGIKNPIPKVNVSFLQIPRHQPNQPGVTAILVEGNADRPQESIVVPVPSSL